MPAVVVLDTNPLGNASIELAKQGKIPTHSQLCRQWLVDCESAGTVILVPAICYYEALRELERRGATSKVSQLKDFVFSTRPLHSAYYWSPRGCGANVGDHTQCWNAIDLARCA
jgi:predicted nucleic acid-binding protein